MQIEGRREGSVLIVKPLESALDAYAAGSFRDQMDDYIRQGDQRIVLDLSQVQFLDSTGLGAIVASYKRMDGRGTLVICRAGEMVLDVFRLTRMDRVFPIVPDEQQAVERATAFAGRSAA